MKTRILLLLAAALLLSGLTGCGGGQRPSSAVTRRVGGATIAIRWPARPTRLIPVAANAIVVTFHEDGNEIARQVFGRPSEEGETSEGVFENLPVKTLTVRASAHPDTDGGGTAQASAQASVDIAQGQTVPVRLALETTIARVQVGLENRSDGAAARYLPDETGDAFATAYDAQGNVVLTEPTRWQWELSAGADGALEAQEDRATFTVRSPGDFTVTLTESESGVAETRSVTVIAPGLANSTSPKLLANLPNTGFVGGLGLPVVAASAPPTLRDNDRMDTAAALGEDGSLFTVQESPSGSAVLKKRDANGNEVARVSLNDGASDALLSATSPLLTRDGSVLVGNDGGAVFCFDAAHLNLRWITRVGGAITTSLTTDPEGRVYFGSADGGLYALNLASGQVLWRFAASGAIRSLPAILIQEGNLPILTFGSDDGKVYQVDGRRGQERWRFAAGGPVKGPAVLGLANSVLIGSDDGFLYALSLDDGALQWKHATGAPVRSAPALHPGDPGEGAVALVTANQVRFLDPATGVLIHAVLIEVGAGESNPVYAEAVGGELWLMVVSGDQFYLISPESEVTQQVTLPQPSVGTPVTLPGGATWVGTHGGLARLPGLTID